MTELSGFNNNLHFAQLKVRRDYLESVIFTTSLYPLQREAVISELEGVERAIKAMRRILAFEHPPSDYNAARDLDSPINIETVKGLANRGGG